jgi:hypothetical protein
MPKRPPDSSTSSTDLGPQNPRDDAYTARQRLHQSWYRQHVLQVPCGVGPKASNKTLYGNMLTREDGQRGLNFLTPHIYQVARRRLAARGAPLDSFQLLCNMLSSQTLAFNLFAPLVDNKDLARRLVEATLAKPVREVVQVDLEYIPEPVNAYLNDRTTYHVFVEYINQDGKLSFLGIDPRLVDPLPERTYSNPTYQKWAAHEHSPFLPEKRAELEAPELNLIWRGHLLAAALRLHPDSLYTEGYSLLLYPQAHNRLEEAARRYRSLLNPEDETFSSLSLEALLERWAGPVENTAFQPWLESFRLRYLDLPASAGALTPPDAPQ